MTCLLAFAAAPVAAQTPKAFVVGIKNSTDMDIIVKGYTIVNGVQRAGPILQITKGDKSFEINVPPGIRFYTVYDANYKILLRDQPVPVQNRNIAIEVATAPGGRVIIR